MEIRSASLSEDSIIAGKIKLTADVRTNRIHVMTRPVNMPFVRKLIAEFDSPVEFGTPVARPLRFVPVADVLDVVVKAITEPGMKEDKAAAATGSTPQNKQSNTSNSSNGNANQRAAYSNSNSSAGGGGSGGSSSA